jgi:uncharacterized cupredoxin-like copper-binding protein
MKRHRIALGGAGLVAGVALLLPVVAAAKEQATSVSITEGKPSEFALTVAPKSVKHGAVTFKVKNSGSLPHDFKICASSKGGTANACTGKVTKLINPGSSATLAYTFKTKGTYEYLCTVPGHAAAGMKGDLKVT